MQHRFLEEQIGPGHFWTALGCRPMGAVVVTARHDGRPAGFLGLSFSHISATPPRVLVSVGRTTGALDTLLAAGCFAANVLPKDSAELARAFGGKAGAAERFSGGNWTTMTTGAPVLETAAAVFDCEVTKTVEDEGAIILLGKVVELGWSGGRGATVAAAGAFVDFPDG